MPPSGSEAASPNRRVLWLVPLLMLPLPLVLNPYQQYVVNLMFVYVPVVQSTSLAPVSWIVLSIVGPVAAWPTDETSRSGVPSASSWAILVPPAAVPVSAISRRL